MRVFTIFCAVVALLASLVTAQQKPLYIAFARSFSGAPAPYVAADLRKLSGGARVRSISASRVDPPFNAYASSNRDFSYTDSVLPGQYKITLGFAEIVGQYCALFRRRTRRFQVLVNDVVVNDDLNIYQAASGCYKPYRIETTATVGADGALVVSFKSIEGPPMISTLDVEPDESEPAPVPSPSSSSSPAAPSPSSSTSVAPSPSSSSSAAPPSPSPSPSTIPSPSSSSSAAPPSPSSSPSSVPSPSSSSSAAPPSPSSSTSPIPSPSSSSSAAPPSPSSSSSSVPSPSSSSSAAPPSPSSSTSAVPPSPSSSSSAIPSPSSSSSAAPPSPSSSSSAIPSPSSSSSAAPPSPSSSSSAIPSPSSSSSAAPPSPSSSSSAIPSPSSSSSAAPPSPSSSSSAIPSPSSSSSAAPPSPSSSSSAIPSPSSSSSAAPPSPSSSSSAIPSPSSSSSAAPPSPSSSSSAAPPSPSSSSSAIPSPSSSSSAAPPSPSSSSSPIPSPSPSSSAAPPSPSSSSSSVPSPSASSSAEPSPSTSSPPVPSPSSSSSVAPPSPSSSTSPVPSPSSSSSAAPPSPTPSTSPAAATTDSVLIDVGSASDPAVSGSTKYSSSSSFTGTSSIPASAFKTGRSGSDFTYSFDLQPGAYDIILGFAEYASGFCSQPGKRVFNVYVNGEIQLESVDLYDANGCFKGVEEKLSSSVGSVITTPLTIRFEAIVGSAIVSYLSISPAENGCIPASNSGGLADGEDHAAHSVPGSYPPQINANSPKSYVDSDGDGFVSVTIDGSGSHSHFFDNANNIIGQITEYTWTLVETGEVLSKQVSFTYNFPLGTTRLKLAVVDNSCTTDEAETTVTVTGSIQPGMYCYYYSGLPMIMGGDPLGNPQFAAVAATPNLGFPTFSFSGSTYLARCFFFLEVDADAEAAAVSVSASGGTARVYKGEDLLLDTDGMASSSTELAVGLLAFEIIFERTSTSGTPAMQFKVGGSVPSSSKVFYDQSVVKPILQLLTPSDGPDSGGTSVKVTGFGLFQPLTVKFGGQTVSVGGTTTSEQFFVTSPPAGSDSVVQVVATTSGGLSSNALEFAYGSVCDSIGFVGVDMKTAGGQQVDFLQLPTCVTIGGDGKLYIGTLGATVQVLGYNTLTDTPTVDFHCYSKALLDNNFQKNSVPAQRDILGITFDPRDAGMKPYVSTQTLFWFDKDRVDRSNKAAWRNGAIDRLKPGNDPSDSKVCLVYDKRIVSGLPISNHDHGVNQIVFTQGGDLLITVGGFTNAGLPQYRLGNYWETTLSAAILIAKLSKGGSFDGNIVYSNDDEPRLSKQIGGDVDVYCTGLRNPFAMAMTGSGDVYSVDQGPNCNFGNTATTCNDYDETAALEYNRFKPTTWPGMVKHGCSKFPYSISRPDKVVHITQGSYYGHPNLQRGGDECAWIDPFDDKTADDKAPPARYKKEMATLQSSVTGIGEYRSNHFCGALRGDLIMSTHKGGKTYRMGVNGGSKTSGPDTLASNGGISFIEDAHGALIFPMLNQAKVFVLRPKVGAKAGVYVANAVPWRHGKGGGTKVVVGGKNFGASPSVTIGGSTCSVTSSSETEITCTVPSSSSGLKDLVVTSSTGGSATLPKAILYMN